jgi:hypothetical protein
MSPRIVIIGLALAVIALPSIRGSRADEPKKSGELSVSDLYLEVSALRTLYYLKATPEQAQVLLKLAPETAGKAKKSKTLKVSAEYRQLLTDLRDALADDDEERVESLEDQLEELTMTENPELDDHVKITEAARKRVPEVLRLFRSHQVATYIGGHVDEIADPEEKLLDALDKVSGWQLVEWKQKRDELGDEIAMLVCGLDKKKANKARDDTIELLARARMLKSDELTAQRSELEREAKRITSQVGPTDVLRNVVEIALAEMLSNPQVEPALRARTK